MASAHCTVLQSSNGAGAYAIYTFAHDFSLPPRAVATIWSKSAPFDASAEHQLVVNYATLARYAAPCSARRRMADGRQPGRLDHGDIGDGGQ